MNRRRTTVGYAVVAAADVALSALTGTPWADKARWLTKPLLMPLLAADVRRRRGETASRASRIRARMPADRAPTRAGADETSVLPTGAKTIAAQGATLVPVLAGIGLSWIGDVALMFPTQAAFALGLSGFLAAHVSYCWGFIRRGGAQGLRHRPALALPALALAGAGAALIVPFATGLQIPVAGYVAVIGTMAALATGTLNRASIAGAGLFCVSDLILALGKFRDLGVPDGVIGAAVMATYTAGQYWISRGLQDSAASSFEAPASPSAPIASRRSDTNRQAESSG